jgi:hypothetical protein
MQKHKNKIIAAACIVCALAVAWVWGANYAGGDADSRTPSSVSAETPGTEAGAPASDNPEAAESTLEASTERADDASPADAPPRDETADSPEPGVSEPAAAGSPESPKIAETANAGAETPPAEAPGMVIDPETGKDRYLTDPVPAGKPIPVEPQNVSVGEGAFTCTLSVHCDTITGNMKLLDKEKHELVPDDGVIFPATTVTFYEGESVFNVLQREMKRAKIHMEFMNTPIYNSAYIEGINNLYEFDVGELSGWMYKVNDWYPNYGCSRYQLKDGDVIEWRYTCDLGRDLGEYWLGGSLRLDR